MMNNSPFELYIHIPFCKQKCLYCDFTSFSCCESSWMKYLDALCRDLTDLAGDVSGELVSIFIGGGTPSLMPVGFYHKLFEAIRKNYVLSKACEITIEANPGTLTTEKLREYRDCGINRLSLGLQSTHDSELNQLGRIHSYQEFLDSYKRAVDVGFENINVDLMMAFPTQTVESYAETLRRIVELRPKHISAYGLIVEPNTPYEVLYERNPELFPDEELQCALYRQTVNTLHDAGYVQYEISNFALLGYACEHNRGYWIRRQYLGIGLAAASLIGRERRSVTSDLEVYLDHLEYSSIEGLSEEDAISELVMLSLRTTEGLNVKANRDRFGEEYSKMLCDSCRKYVANGLMREEDGRFFFTTEGFLVSNRIIAELLP